jgi:hypothetical protein
MNLHHNTRAQRARLAILGTLALGGTVAVGAALLPATGLAATSAAVPAVSCLTTSPPTTTSPPVTTTTKTAGGPDTQADVTERTRLSAGIVVNAVQTFTLTARLTSGRDPLCGQTIVFGTGFHRLCTATTNQYGVAFCVLNGSQALLVDENTFTIWAHYAGDADDDPAFATAVISIFP